MGNSRNKAEASKTSSEPHPERRKEARTPVSQPGIIKTNTGDMAVAELLNVSRTGFRVTSPRALPVDSEVEVLFENTRLLGDVRNCVSYDSNKFHIGVGNARPTSIARRIYDPTPVRVRDE